MTCFSSTTELLDVNKIFLIVFGHLQFKILYGKNKNRKKIVLYNVNNFIKSNEAWI